MERERKFGRVVCQDVKANREKRGREVRRITFKYDVPLEETMEFETVYHPNLQLDLADKKEIWETPGAFFVWMFVDGQLAGESYGIPLASPTDFLENLLVLPEREGEKAVCCYSNTILPAFQKRGLASILKAHWLGLAAGKGFDVVYGHARPGGSQALNAKFGAVFLENLPDWFGSGEDYRKYRLVLNPKKTE
jgi:GNAT superfamily N-acetyltransferase